MVLLRKASFRVVRFLSKMAKGKREDRERREKWKRRCNVIS